QPADLPPGLEPYIGPASPLIAKTKTDHASGIVMLNDVPMIMTSRAILPGNQEGSVAGTLIFGRILDEGKVQQIAQETQLTLAVRRLNDPQLPSDFQTANTHLSPTSPVVVQPLNNEWVDGYTKLNNIDGSPILYLKIELNRDIYAQG